MESTFLSLNVRDLLKGLVMAVLSPVLTIIIQSAQQGSLVFDWKAIATTAIAAAGAYLLKNFFSDETKVAQKVAEENGQKIVPKNARVLPVIIGLLLFCGAANAQKGFFGRVQIKQPTVQARVTNGKSITFQNVKVSQNDSTFNAIRPEASVGTIFAGGTAKVVAGTGIAFQRITYTYPKGTVGQSDYVEGRSYVNFSVGLHILAGVSINDNIPAKIPSAALLFSALNGQVSAGPAYGDFRNINTGNYEGKWGLMLNWKINFNN